METRRRKRHNRIVSGTRILVKQSIGTLKMRFPILRGEMRFKPHICAKIFMTCIILHNFLISTGAGFIEDVSHEQVPELGIEAEENAEDNAGPSGVRGGGDDEQGGDLGE